MNQLAPRQPTAIAEAPTVLTAITKGEVDMQVATARAYPRDVQNCVEQAIYLATLNVDVAQSCIYSRPQGGETIKGPSIRLAEIVASTWGNLRCETRIVEVGKDTVTASGSCWDMQTNVRLVEETQRSIVGRNGRRYSPDLIVTTGNAARSIALRNAIFKIVPGPFVDEIYKRCVHRVAHGDGDVSATAKRWVAHFVKQGVAEENIYRVLEKEVGDTLEEGDVEVLVGIHTALQQRATTLEAAFSTGAARGQPFGFSDKGEGQGES